MKYLATTILSLILLPLSTYAAGPMTVVFEQNPLFGEVNMVPGHAVSRTVSVTNNDTVIRSVYTGVNSTGNDGGLANGLNLAITSPLGTHYSDTLSVFFATSSVYLGNLAPAETRIYTFAVEFSSSSGNGYQATTANFDLLFGFGPEIVNNDDNDNDNDGGGGGGGGGGGNSNNDEPDGPTPQVAGATTDNGGPIQDLIRRLTGTVGDTWQRVLGNSTTTEELEETVTTSGSVAAAASSGPIVITDPSCLWWWLFVVIWLVASAAAWWLRREEDSPVSVFTVQILFWIAAMILLVLALFFGFHCAWWPALIVGIGTPALYFLANRPKDTL